MSTTGDAGYLHQLCVFVVAAEQAKPRDVVTRNQPLNFVQHGGGIVRAHLGFEIVLTEPYGMTVGLARLRASGLAHVGARTSTAERHQLVHVVSHGKGDTHNALEIVAYPGELAGFL